ncbi:MAG TPA: hypothetical protein VGM59_06095 [Dongiaceae bacterium]
MNVAEMKERLLAEGLRPGAANFNERGAISEQYVIEKSGATWHVYYGERGHKNDFRSFPEESSACAYLLSILETDRSVWGKAGSGSRRALGPVGAKICTCILRLLYPH